MEHYGVILKKLRELRHLSVKQAANLIGRSAGWISGVENARGRSKLSLKEFERVVAIYNGEPYRKQFGIWLAMAKSPRSGSGGQANLSGAIFRHLRKQAKMTLAQVSKSVGFSGKTLSAMELGYRTIQPELKSRLMHLYGYNPSSFKNFVSDKRSKTIPTKYKLDLLIRHLDVASVEKIFAFAHEVRQHQQEGE